MYTVEKCNKSSTLARPFQALCKGTVCDLGRVSSSGWVGAGVAYSPKTLS